MTNLAKRNNLTSLITLGIRSRIALKMIFDIQSNLVKIKRATIIVNKHEKKNRFSLDYEVVRLGFKTKTLLGFAYFNHEILMNKS